MLEAGILALAQPLHAVSLDTLVVLVGQTGTGGARGVVLVVSQTGAMCLDLIVVLVGQTGTGGARGVVLVVSQTGAMSLNLIVLVEALEALAPLGIALVLHGCLLVEKLTDAH
jgi:hypothetical protein